MILWCEYTHSDINILVAIAYLPVAFIQRGYRIVHLYDKHGDLLNMSKLFVRISFDGPDHADSD